MGITTAAASLTVLLAMGGQSGLVATDVIRAGDTITASNVSSETGAMTARDRALIGREVHRTVYEGQAIDPDNTRAARLVKRNQMVTVKYIRGALEISTTGRAMGEAAANEPVTVMNLKSRELVHGVVHDSGWVLAQ